MKTIFFFLLFASGLSCNKSDEEAFPVSILAMSECHHTNEWNEASTMNKLLGTWIWEFTGYAYTGNYVPEERYAIEFKDDNTLNVFKRGKLVQTSTWIVADGDGDLFEIEESPIVDHIFGRIYFCDNRMLIQGSYMDLTDNFFTKAE